MLFLLGTCHSAKNLISPLHLDVFPQSEDTRMVSVAPGDVVTEMALEDLEESDKQQCPGHRYLLQTLSLGDIGGPSSSRV